MRTIILIAFLFAIGLVNAASNPPTPAPAESTGKPKPNTTQVNQGSKSSDKVTKSSSAIVVVPDSPDVNIKATDKTDNGSGYSSPEWWMVYINAALVLITAAMAYYTACMWSATKTMVDRSEASAQRQSSEMKESIAIASKSVDLSEKQADLAERQHGLQRWGYLATNRPKLIIHRISLDGGNGDWFTPGSKIPKIQFSVANIGGSRATIIESNATFVKIEGHLPALPPYSMDIDTLKTTVREAGQSDPPETLDIVGVELVREISSWNNKILTNTDNSPYYFFGYIQYRDDVDIVRRMTFCRRYNAGTKRFIEVNDPEYEYSD